MGSDPVSGPSAEIIGRITNRCVSSAIPSEKSPIITTPGCFAKTPDDMAILLDVMIGSDNLDKQSFDLNDFFKNININQDIFSSYKLGWLSDMNGNYKYEDGILDLCENGSIHFYWCSCFLT